MYVFNVIWIKSILHLDFLAKQMFLWFLIGKNNKVTQEIGWEVSWQTFLFYFIW